MADNPFSALLNPDKQGTITGFLGGVLGYPTASQAGGAATGAALQELTALRQQGQSPQQALINFLQTPKGIEYFTQAGPDGLKSLTDGLAATVPPSPTVHNVPVGGQLWQTDPNTQKTTMIGNNPKIEPNPVLKPGEQMFSPSGAPIEGASVPMQDTEAVRTFQAFATLAKLPQLEIRRLAALNADPTKDPTEKGIAINKLVSDYGLDPQTGEKLKAGVLQIVPQKDGYGNTTGDVSLIDLSNPAGATSITIKPGQSINSPAPGVKPTSGATLDNGQVATPGVTPGQGAGTGVLPPTKVDPTQNKKYFGSMSDMFLGVGVVPHAVGAASKIGETISPDLISSEGAKANDRQTQLAHLTNTLLSMGEVGNGFGINKSIIQSFKDLIPDPTSLFETPHSAVQKGIRLLQKVQNEISAEESASANMSLPQSERVSSAKRAEGWRRVERAMPSMEEMGNMEAAIRNGTAGAQNLEAGAKSIFEQGKKGLASGKQQATGIANAAGIDTSGDPYANMNEGQLQGIDPRSLSKPALVQYRNRIRALIAKGGANGRAGQ